MSVKPIIPSIDSNNNARKTNIAKNSKKDVSFSGTNPIVDTMNFIEKGGYAVSFCIQDGLGFILPRVGEGLVRGSKKVDENGNPVLDEKGKQVREYNWALAQKELLRELITGPSAFLIPWAALKGINKLASGNNVKLNYINGFNNAFTDFAQNNLEAIKAGNAPKVQFYQRVFENVLEDSLNVNLPEAEKLTSEEIKNIAADYAQRKVKIEEINADKSLSKKIRNDKIAQVGSIEDSYMKLRKGKIGGTVNEAALSIRSTDGKLRGGSIGELVGALDNYYKDAVSSLKKSVTDNADVEIKDAIKSFTHQRMGTRVLTNLGLFGLVAAFYTQIPKIYNAGQKGNPALKGTAADPTKLANAAAKKDSPEVNGKDVSFGGLGSMVGKVGNAVFNNKTAKSVSDIFELNGPVISGAAMPVLLYGFCIPPRLNQAQDKYDYGEIILRDFTSFTTLLFGANALSRLFSDLLTKQTGLALNRKDMEGRNTFQKVLDYLSPSNSRHAVLSSAELDSKYTNIRDYKGGINGFIEFVEKSGGNIKKAFTHDKSIKTAVENILSEFNGKTFEQATVTDIKEALKAAHNRNNALINNLYQQFEKPNGLLKAAKTCNSTFKFISTFVLVPGLIIWLTKACKKMTEKRTAEDIANAKQNAQPAQAATYVSSNVPTMVGLMKK
ncbi:MAG: hypothetical protein ACI37Q_06885 [Candidatus Gastranaerophilaceae bacterium]